MLKSVTITLMVSDDVQMPNANANDEASIQARDDYVEEYLLQLAATCGLLGNEARGLDIKSRKLKEEFKLFLQAWHSAADPGLPDVSVDKFDWKGCD